MSNLWKRFQNLLPADPLLIAEVLTHNTDGTSTVQFPGGGQARAKGQTVAIGDKAYIQGGWVRAQAPDLPVYEFEI